MMQALPEGYWSRGLHDAAVTSVTETDLVPDFSSSAPRWNRLDLDMDARGALMDTAVRRITLFNYKVLAGDLSDAAQPRTWWFSDTLAEDKGSYVLTITFSRGRGEVFDIRIRFTDGTVERS